MKRTLVVGAVALVAGLASSAALADQSYTDPTSDSQTAPDVTGIDVVNDDDGEVGFRIVWAGGQPLPKDDVIYLVIDTDRDARTGGEEGEEVVLEFDGDPSLPGGGSWYDAHWDGSKIDWDWDAQTAQASFRSGEIDVLISTSDLNATKEFDFWVYSDQYSGDKIVAEDVAPDGTAVYTYEVETSPPPPPSNTRVRLDAGRPAGTPAAPVAGKRFVVSVHVTRADAQPLTGAKVRCTARAGTKVVKATGSVSSGVARCSMSVPKGSKGKMLRGSIAVSMSDAHATKTYAFKIH